MNLRHWRTFLISLATVAVIGIAMPRASSETSDASQTAGPIEVEVRPWRFASLPADGRVAPGLYWRGGMQLISRDPRFGGLSGLALSGDGGRMLAVSDDGWWLGARLVYDKGNLTGMTDAMMAPIVDETGKRAGKKRQRDAEALTLLKPGDLAGQVTIGFESRTRVATYDLRQSRFHARPRRISVPTALRQGPSNRELEALAFVPRGHLAGAFVAISELNIDGKGNIRGWVFGNRRQSFSFAVARSGDFAVTDIAVLPDGDLILLERSFSRGSFPGFALRRVSLADIKPDATVVPIAIFEGRLPRYSIDNMEGVAVHVTADGETRITVMSDDNFNRSFQNTILLQFALRD